MRFESDPRHPDLRPVPRGFETLEDRSVPAVTAQVLAGTLIVQGTAEPDTIDVVRSGANLIVTSLDVTILNTPDAGITGIQILGEAGNDRIRMLVPDLPSTIDGGAGNDVILIGSAQPTTVTGGAGKDLIEGGSGNDLIDGGDSVDTLYGGAGNDTVTGGLGADRIDGQLGDDRLGGDAGVDTVLGGLGNDLLSKPPGERDRVLPVAGDDLVIETAQSFDALAQPDVLAFEAQVFADLGTDAGVALTATDVQQLLNRASAATASNDAIIAIVDRTGRILGVRVEAGVDPAITGDPDLLTFAIDGAVAKARTGALFGNNQAPLTSRTIEFISQSTKTQREIESNPNVSDPNSTARGPGFVAPVNEGGHFPPNIAFTPQVDLFGIEHTNRDGTWHPGADRLRGTGDDILLSQRFNADGTWIPAGRELPAPDSYGFAANPADPANRRFQSRGIATLPGGIPLYRLLDPTQPASESNPISMVGGIGVFFPGRTGFATEENSALSNTYDSTKPDRSAEAEYIAFVAAGGSSAAGVTFGAIGGTLPVPGFDLPSGRIDLVGITLDVFGPCGQKGIDLLFEAGAAAGPGTPSGVDLPVAPGMTYLAGSVAPEGWLVLPHAGVTLSADDVFRLIRQGYEEAVKVRAAIRLPLDSRTRMVLAVTDIDGEVLGLFRMPDATIFSIDVAVAKARNVAYTADATVVVPSDLPAGVPAGAALTNRTYRYLGQPRFPLGIDGTPPGPYSIFNDGGSDPFTGLATGPAQPASSFQSVFGFDAFNPGTNFKDPDNVANQNGIVFFPGSSPVYKDLSGFFTRNLAGGFGVSGDGVDQDDVVTFSGSFGYAAPETLRADQFFVRDVRLPYQKFNRSPRG